MSFTTREMLIESDNSDDLMEKLIENDRWLVDQVMLG